MKNQSKVKSVVQNSKVTINCEDISRISHHDTETNSYRILEQLNFIDEHNENHVRAYLVVLKYLFYKPRFGLEELDGQSSTISELKSIFFHR